MIVLKENQRLYLHSCNYNMARMMSALANLVKEHGGRVKPTRQALISDRNCKDAEPIKVTHTSYIVQEISPATIERKADGTLDRESPNYIVEWQLIAEMLFETEALYRHLVPGKIWNEYEMAAAYIRKTIGQEEENEED